MPGEVALVFEFVNSVDHRSFVYQGQRNEGGDELRDVAGLRRWLAERALLRKRSTVSAADLAAARALRDGLRAAISAHCAEPVAGGSPPARFARLPLVGGVDEQGLLRLHPGVDGVLAALSAVLIEAITAGGTGRWQRLKMCGAPDCRWIFFDASKPATARWCETGICGNRIKKSNQRARRRGDASPRVRRGA